jgi:AcrR family transcriptional regulator
MNTELVAAGKKPTKLNSTREKILDTAEALFAEHGVTGVSMREITRVACVNLAAINYYFGKKEELIAEVFARRALPIIDRRHRLLALCVEGDGRPPMLEQLIDAFIRPGLESSGDPGGVKFMQLRARLVYERDPAISKLFPKFFDTTTRLFIGRIAEVLPHLTKEEVFLRFTFLLGTMVYWMANPSRMESLSAGLLDSADPEGTVREMIPFLAAGFRMPSLHEEGHGVG